MKLLLALLVPTLAFADEVKLGDAAKAFVDAIAKVDLENEKFGETLSIATIAPLTRTRARRRIAGKARSTSSTSSIARSPGQKSRCSPV